MFFFELLCDSFSLSNENSNYSYYSKVLVVMILKVSSNESLVVDYQF